MMYKSVHRLKGVGLAKIAAIGRSPHGVNRPRRTAGPRC